MKLKQIKGSPIGSVVCGFPGVGKSTLFTQLKERGLAVLDSDSSKFDKRHFPQNYIEHIKSAIEDNKVVLASSHDTVRNALIKEKIPFTLVYPDVSLKEEYIERYSKRGSPEAFIKLISSNWEKWLEECEDLSSPLVTKVKLKSGEFLDKKHLSNTST